MKVRLMSKPMWAAIALLGTMMALACAGPASASTPTPPFTQCPALGFDAGCAILIVVQPNGTLVSYADPSQSPFDGIEDTLIGVQNESGSTVSSIALQGTVFPGIFEFDGDGLCSGQNEGGGSGFLPPPAGCPFGPTTYEGPNTSFTVVNGNEGTVNFFEGTLVPGKSAYFSLEGVVSLTCSGSSCTGGPPNEAKETSLVTSLLGGGQSGEGITVSAGTPVTDQATLGGENASTAAGTVDYSVYSDLKCTQLAAGAGTVKVSGGEVPPSNSEVFYLPGTYYWQASYSGDATNDPSVSECGAETETVSGIGGNFVIGDKNASVGGSVTFWGAQWRKLNLLSGGIAPASFKGFEASPSIAACGKSWTADPGNSTPPPVGPLPAYVPVIVASKIDQSGSLISGNTVHVDLVKVNPGYSSDPGHPGTGTIVSQIC
jgi:hypothetical protein